MFPGKTNDNIAITGINSTPAIIVAGSPNPTPSSTAINHLFLSVSRSFEASCFLFFSTASASGPNALANTPVINGNIVITADSETANPKICPQAVKVPNDLIFPKIPIISPKIAPSIVGSPKTPNFVFNVSGFNFDL